MGCRLDVAVEEVDLRSQHVGLCHLARQERIDAFIHEGSPPAGQPLEILCEDHVGTYVISFLCHRDRFAADVENDIADLEAVIGGDPVRLDGRDHHAAVGLAGRRVRPSFGTSLSGTSCSFCWSGLGRRAVGLRLGDECTGGLIQTEAVGDFRCHRLDLDADPSAGDGSLVAKLSDSPTLAPASIQSDRTQTPTEPAAASDAPKGLP